LFSPGQKQRLHQGLPLVLVRVLLQELALLLPAS
jgi:hypothetical protein